MWGDPDTDPGGGTPGPGPSRENKDLKEHNEQQQVLIAQLKEMLRKEQSTVPQEKVEEYVNTLSKAKAKKSRSKRDDSGSTEKSTSMDSKKHEKVNLMKQQLEENKAKLAERGMRQKDIEDMVSMLKVQLNDSSLQLMSSVSASLPNLEKNLEYNKNTSPEELYNILLVKEKKIMDLLEKGQKQEATILDLQENLKEKDSVLDARTKAITLMTENLSKKSKDTLDTLDETKEQMRKMQENFITLESEMKARQMLLLNDLKSKNIEIADLQEKNNKLLEDINKLRNHNDKDENESDNYELLLRDLNSKLADSKNVVKENQATIELLRTEINELKEKLLSKHQDQNESDGITKLKKQLDESNKNMIKVKAQHKSKIKDLNKKLDGFKKMSDANATIIQLQNENTKLNEKIAELEEEKGNMQLKMVESIESTKGSINSDDFRELHEKFERNLDESEAKDKVINLLESDIISLKTELKDLNDKMSGFSQLKNEKVTSEMQSIQIEEQLEILESSNKELHNEIEILRREKAELLEKIEEFIKEKMELTTKLDNYIQENMELIDKLEKLSAEKVSSAESIEIVEGLTQQEKLELAAYQKNIDPNIEDSVKAQEEEPPAELNESVLQLTEETAELLKKIEMFNMERKEVMIKLEALREENNQLSLKLNEVENNREVLAETYEQVQTEKDELVKENETLIRKLRELENQQYPQETNEDKDKEVFLKLEYLQKEYERVLEENNNLKKCIKELNEVIQEKDHLETELRSCKEKSEGLELKVKENIDEINNYRSIIEENKSELINSSNIINQLQTELGERDNNINELNSFINDLNNVVADLQEANLKLNNFEDMEYQLNQIKTALNEQVESAEKQVQEFREELDFNKTLYENELEKKNREIDQLTQEIAFKEEMIITLKQQLKDKDQSVKSTIEKMKEKYIGLQAQLNANSESLKKQVEDLAAKNKEQLEKMKKIAANLKKKTQTYQELEEKYNAEKEKWETEINKKETGSQDIESLKLEISMKGTLLGQSEARIHELSYIVSNLEQQNVDLQNMLLEARQRQEKSPELSLKQELSSSLHEEFDNVHGSKESINEDKIKEMQLIIETHEVELHHYKERSQMLEEDLAILLEEKDRLLVKSREMEAKLSLLSKSVEEKSLMEEKMDHKLQEVAANDEVLAKQVEELTKENKELLVKTRDQEEMTTKLKIKIKKLQDKISQMKNMQTCLEEQEQANTELKRQIVQLEALQKQMQQEYEEKLNQHQKDYDGIESDYQLQLEGLVKSRNELTFECERLQEEVKGLKEREEELLMELTGNNQKLSDVENKYNNEIAVLTGNLNQTTSNWQSSVEKIETLQMEVNSLQSQMLSNAAKETVEEVLSDAKSKVNTQLSVTIHNYSFQGESPPQDPDVSVTKEDLENKIKALEILLYNVDQEKEEVIQECSDMLNELTRLVYEKVGNNALSTVPTVASLQPLSDVESQILSFEEIDAQNDRQTLQKLEFETTDPSLGQQNVPVEENVGHPSIAYLTYQPNQPLNEEESDFGLERHPVVESFAQISKAHLMGEAVGENDDGWGWGPEEARLEEEHQYKAENTPQIQALKVEVDKLKEKIQILQTERETHLEEIKQLQIKSSKLVKKCKEFKLKNDELIAKTKSDTDNFFDLDQTIQEELKTQIERLETKIKEITLELDKEKLEKLNTVKKLEVVTASNEKMIQMSQIQDSEIYRWKRKYEQVEEKLNWGSEESKSPIETPKEYTEDVEELRKLVQDLTVDNEELQALLNDQKQQRVQLERSSKSIDNDERIKNLEEDILSKEAFINKLNEENEQFKIMHNQNTNVIIECSEKQSTNLLDELDKKNTVIQELEKSLKNLTSSLREKENQLENNNHKLEDIESLLVTKTARIEQLQNSNDSLVEEISTLRHEIECLKQDFANAEANTSENHPNQFQYQHQQPVDDIHPLIQELTDFKANTIRELVELVNNFDQIIAEKIKDLTEELSSQKQRYRDLQSVSSKNILELQLALEDQKQLEVENNEKLKEAIDQLEKAKRKLVDIELDNEQINNYSERIRELEAELSNLQSLSAKNILELQIALEEQKRKNDQLEVENVDKIKELEKKYTELEFVLQLTQGKSDNDKEVQINELNVMIKNLQDNNNELEGSIKELKDRLNAKEQELDRTVSEMENKLVETVTEVEEKWAAQVDERGNTVAESWKYHLSIVESDFAAIQDKLKNELNELEEKCNALVNENNELRRNVDTEIKQEVDRISALQQQINDRQRAINELKQLLTTEQLEKAAMAQQISEIDKIHQLLADKEVELASLKILAEATRQQFDEKRQVVEEIVKLLEQNTAFPLSCENKDILNELRRQLSLSCDKNQKVDNLHSQLQNANIQIQTYSIAIQEREAEISRLNEVYEKQFNEITELNKIVEQLKEQAMQITEKDENIRTLQSTIEEYDIRLSANQQEIQNLQQQCSQLNYSSEEGRQAHDSLQNVIAQKEQEIGHLNQEIQNLNVQIINLTHQLETFKENKETSLHNVISQQENEISNLNQQMHNLKLEISNLNQQLLFLTDNKESEKLEAELAQHKEEYLVVQQSLRDCQQQLFDITQDLATKSHEHDTVSQQLAYVQQHSDLLQDEINKLKETLHIKEQEYFVSIENIQKTNYKELESHYEEILSAKDLDIQTLRTQVAESVYNANENLTIRNELEESNKQLQARVDELVGVKSDLEMNILQQTSLTKEENKQLDEMRSIIEEQVVKIEELKKELFEKSNDYDSIIAEMDISRNAITQQPTLSSSRTENPSAATEERPAVPEYDLSEPVNRAELDLALYMLHQRDVRCEELTVELTQLLEERDTLQLRLSNAIREKEELRRNVKEITNSPEVPLSSSASNDVLLGTSKTSRSSEIFLAASGTELAAEPSEKLGVDQDLAKKLSELKTVGYKKDKTFVDEQEKRRFQQISIMQQHIKEASKLPPEAAAKLVDASYTLSRDVQSPSKVLLNWLWGRSTPRVNDT